MTNDNGAKGVERWIRALKQWWPAVLIVAGFALVVSDEATSQAKRVQIEAISTPARSAPACYDIFGLAIDSKDQVWVGTVDCGLRVLTQDGIWTTYTTANSGLTSDWINAIAFDADGRAWVGTNDGLNMLAQDGTWTTYTSVNSNLADDYVLALAIDGEGQVWVGTRNTGLSVLKSDGTWTTYTTANSSLAGDWADALAIDGEGRVWVGTGDGLNVINPDGSWTTYTTANSGLIGDSVYDLAFDDEGRIWIGTYGGLSVLALDGTWTTYTPVNSGLADDYLDGLAIDDEGRVWVGTDHSGLSMHAPDETWTTYTTANSNLTSDSIRSIAINAKGQVWVGTYIDASAFDPQATTPPTATETPEVITVANETTSPWRVIGTVAIFAGLLAGVISLFQRNKGVTVRSPIAQPLPTSAETASEAPKLSPVESEPASTPAAIPTDPETAFAQGLTCIEAGKRDEAKACFMQAFRAGSPELRQRAVTELEKLGEVEVH